jgi:hypothetical protein
MGKSGIIINGILYTGSLGGILSEEKLFVRFSNLESEYKWK